MNRIYVIHENEAWVEPLRAAFEETWQHFWDKSCAGWSKAGSARPRIKGT